jgi:hypothetical protein
MNSLPLDQEAFRLTKISKIEIYNKIDRRLRHWTL